MNEIIFHKFREQLADSSRAIADLTAMMIYENPELFNQMIGFMLTNDPVYSPRAARVISICSLRFPELYLPQRHRVVRALKRIENEAIIRNILKIYESFPMPYTKTENAILVPLCFDYLLSGECAIAIKVFSMEILFRISKMIPEIAIELYSVIDNQISFGSAGFKSRGQKILQKLSSL